MEGGEGKGGKGELELNEEEGRERRVYACELTSSSRF